jgi:hypothetical protein
VLRAVTVPDLLDMPDHPLDCRRRVLFQAKRERQIEKQLGIRRSLHIWIQRFVHGERQLSLYAMEVAHEAVVDPKPAAVTEGVAVGLLDGGAGGGADVREEDGRLDVACYLAQVAVVPGRLDAVEVGRGFGIGAVLTDSETVIVCGRHAQAGVEALVDQGVVRLVEQLLEEDRGARVG